MRIGGGIEKPYLCDKIGPDTTLFVEHLPDFESYKQAAAYVREQAELAGVKTE